MKRQVIEFAVACGVALVAFGERPAEARTLSEIRERGAFSICAHPDALPFSSREGSPDGLQIDLARMLANRLGVRLDIEWVAWRAAARRVNCDAIMGSLAHNDDEDTDASKSPPGTLRRVALTHPYARQTTRVVLAEGGAPVLSADDLRGRSVAVIHASYAHYLLNMKNIPVRTLYRTEEEILAAVARKEMSAGIVMDWYAGWYERTHPTAGLHIEESFILDPDLDYDVSITLRNTDAELLKQMNAILGDLSLDGSISRLFSAYGIAYRPPRGP